jgi:hypothetical protein
MPEKGEGRRPELVKRVVNRSSFLPVEVEAGNQETMNKTFPSWLLGFLLNKSCRSEAAPR